MSRPILYGTDVSPPCRGVYLTEAALGLNLELREINLREKEHLKPEFLKLNPQHTVPTLVDNGFVLWDSHAIMCYLVTKYGKDDSLYPKDPEIRAKVDQFLHLDTGCLFMTLKLIGAPIFRRGDSNVSAEKIEILNDTFEVFENILKGKTWLVGGNYTLADISCVSTVSSLTAFRPLDKYPNIQAWLKRCEDKLPGYGEKNTPGNKKLHSTVREILPGYL